MNNRKTRIFLGLLMAGAILMCSLAGFAQECLSVPFSKGEVITYSIKKLMLSVGEATLVYDGPVDLNGKPAVRIVFTSKGFRFFDKEEIYLDPESFYPILIERDLNVFGSKEKIWEFYDERAGKVRIVKDAKGERTQQVLEGKHRFDNIYGFIYRYRRRGEFKVGEEFQLHLPTRDVTFTLVEKGTFKAAGDEWEAYYMDSVPKKYKVWFGAGGNRIPLMIDGAIGFGRTSMVMKEYRKGDPS